ncbi:MAG: peptide chain release factor 1 [Candidatus Pacebacteria bacterium]|nr:peptide chain release factor 1 [Candidatus Paceibacterota bacterium]MDD3072281.1 peptide chain release factor 1 [Candidatus Paceibacterota bacterium]MDD3728861.1 peptide chain release factor 1 [Candidatus Paceibacterota bacterium]MDD4201798.1 peptide chain release factor 1 [Candidatus Paceibacterota bacterium]MDD4467353.1 peptide chain release factor 1 [Candidatus Paceibacterota bacterium]
MSEIESLRKEYNDILNQLGNPELISDWKKFEDLSKKKKKLENIIEKKEAILQIEKQIEENKAIISSEDMELLTLAEAEIGTLSQKKREIEKELKDFLEEENSSVDLNSVIVEIRAGTGGDEAALFAGDLFRAYLKYCAKKNWSHKVLDSNSTTIGGFKEVTFEIKGNNVFSLMENEGGVHRVQRIPETEKSGRVHTSTATVAVLPKPKEKKINIRTDDLKIDFFRASGAGGQNVNKRETAVRITHLPSGVVVVSQTERNQLQNKENALSILGAKIMEQKRKQEQSSVSNQRNSQIGLAKRVEKIKTYNFPQDRLTDHRIKKSWHGLQRIMDGDLDEIIETTKKELQLIE